MRSRAALLVAVALLTAACSGDDDPSPEAKGSVSSTTRSGGTSEVASTSVTTAAPPSTIPPVPVALRDVRVKLTRVGRFDQPLAMAQRPDDPAFYVAEKSGRVRVLRDGQVADAPVLDLSGEVSTGSEQGLLGIAFSPDGNLLYASFTNTEGHSRLWEYAFRNGLADTATKRELFAVDQPFSNHNGGQVVFGPDGLLYYFLGDGGLANDPRGNGQSLNTLLGKALRVDPTPSGALPYTIPPDNPFVGRANVRGEIWSFGLRNPWRNSFDRLTGDLWIGDVGQNALEEIDFTAKDAARGANFGWAAREGSRAGPRPVPTAEGAIGPVHEYPTSDGCAVTGGYVYRGSRIPAMSGAYVFGDFCNGQVQALRLADGKVAERRSLDVTADNLSSFGEDSAGELYAFSLSGALLRFDPA